MSAILPNATNDHQAFASPKASAEYFRRCRVWRRVLLGVFVATAIVVFLLGRLFGGRVGEAAFFIGGLAAFTGILIFGVQFWRCPICGHYFGRGHRTGVCEHCGARFKA